MTGRKTAANMLAVALVAAIAALALATSASASLLETVDGRIEDNAGNPATQAGTHPYIYNTNFTMETVLDPSLGTTWPAEEPQDVAVELPPGVVANTRAIPTCTQAQIIGSGSLILPQCPPESQVGTVRLFAGGFEAGPEPLYLPPKPVYNMVTPRGTPSLLAFNVFSVIVEVYVDVRSGDDYGVTVLNRNIPQSVIIATAGLDLDIWGVPADPEHDSERFCPGEFDPPCESSDSAEPTPYFTLPTSCGPPLETNFELTGWLGGFDSQSFLSHDHNEPPNPIGIDGCNVVDFSPNLEARPTTNVADSPSGLDVDIQIPQNEDPGGTAAAHLKDASLTLPEGLVLNPAAGNGLDGCSPAEFGLTTPVGTTPVHTTADPASCPAASTLGTVQIDTPLLDHPMNGGVYLADPFDNPFNSLLALYVSVDDLESGLVIKLAGKVTPDPATGQLTASFEENPQLPFEGFTFHLFGGAGGALRTPAVCGSHTSTSALVPWTAPDGATASESDTWSITQGPNGGACPSSQGSRPHSPSFDAGTASPIAGARSPLIVSLRRDDGSQDFSKVTVSPPPGLIGALAGIPACPDVALAAAAGKSGKAESAAPSCPVASQVGVVDVAAGAGPAPYHVHAPAYLTGPYRGAPIGLAIITPVTAGPFDLGTIVTRVALHIDPTTAQITADADPIPSILQGIPLDVRAVQIKLDRPGFSLNPTSCDPMAFDGQLISTMGLAAPLSKRFQLGECDALGLAPKVMMQLEGGTSRRAHPALTTTIEPGAGNANLRGVSVQLPATELLDQRHIGTVCTRVQFPAGLCPAASIYGTAIVHSPLLDHPLTGNVYLRSSSNPLPDLVLDLRGPAGQPIKLEAAGKTDTVNGALRSTFAGIPDAPFSKVVVSLYGGRKGLIQNSRNICGKTYRSKVSFTGHNGYRVTRKPKLRARCKGKSQRKNRRHRLAAQHRRAVR
jgi:hypothetical protein